MRALSDVTPRVGPEFAGGRGRPAPVVGTHHTSPTSVATTGHYPQAGAPRAHDVRMPSPLARRAPRHRGTLHPTGDVASLQTHHTSPAPSDHAVLEDAALEPASNGPDPTRATDRVGQPRSATSERLEQISSPFPSAKHPTYKISGACSATSEGAARVLARCQFAKCSRSAPPDNAVRGTPGPCSASMYPGLRHHADDRAPPKRPPSARRCMAAPRGRPSTSVPPPEAGNGHARFTADAQGDQPFQQQACARDVTLALAPQQSDRVHR